MLALGKRGVVAELESFQIISFRSFMSSTNNLYVI